MGATGLVTHFANITLAKQQLSLELEKLHFNPFIWQVTLTSATVKHKENSFLIVDEIKADLDFIALIQGDIVFEELATSTVKLNAELHDGELTFAGWQPKPADNDNSADETNNQAPAFAILVKVLSLKNVDFHLAAEQEHHWEVHQLAVQNFEFSDATIALDFDLKSQFNKRPLNLHGATKYTLNNSHLLLPNLMAHIELADYRQWLPAEMTTLAGEINVAVQIELTQQDKGWLLVLNQLNVKVDALKLPVVLGDADTEIALANLVIATENTKIALNPEFKLNSVKSAMNVQLNDAQWLDVESRAVLASFHLADFNNINLSISDSVELSLSELAINNGVVSQLTSLPSIELDEGEVPAPVMQFEQLKISNLIHQKNTLTIDNITAALSDISLYKSEEFATENLYLLTKSDTKKVTQNAKQETTEPEKTVQKALTINIGEFLLTGEPTVNFYDHTPSTPVAHRLKINTLQLTNISSNQQSLADLLFSADLGQRSSVDIEGKLNVFNFADNSQFNGVMKGLDLTRYSPYVSDAINYKIKQGLLFADIDMQIQDERVKGAVETNIKAIELSKNNLSAKQDERASSIVPLDLALKQLTDEQGNLNVKIPLEGSIHDPSFGIGGFISILTTKALKKGAKNYLIQAFLPYANVVTIAMMAGDTLFDIKVNPLEYQTNQVELLAPQLSYAKELAGVLKEKSDAQLSICALIVPALEGLSLPLSEALSVQYQQLGSTRVNNFIDYLVEQENIAAERLIPCEAVVSTDKTKRDNLSFTIK